MCDAVINRAPPGHVNAFGNNMSPSSFRGGRFPVSRSGPPPRLSLGGPTRGPPGSNQSGRAEAFIGRSSDSAKGSSSSGSISSIPGTTQPHLLPHQLPRGLPSPPFMMMALPPFQQNAPFFDAKFPPPPPPPPFRAPFLTKEGDKQNMVCD